MELEPGNSTAFPFNIQYRIGRVSKYISGGDWLDYGCANGGYTTSLVEHGAEKVVGIDAKAERIEEARQAYPNISFSVGTSCQLLFEQCSFDGVFMNEVFEHVADEERTLEDLHRILRPGGYLIVISPNRWFPFECHVVHIGRWSSSHPMPLIPWLPRSVTDHWVTARNYWPHELRHKIESNGFQIIETGFIMPVFEVVPWMPNTLARGYRRNISFIDGCPIICKFGVSNIVVARRR